MKKKVLILASSFGNGHISVANSIKREFNKQDADIDVSVIDFYDETSPIFNKVARKLYLDCSSKVPEVYGFFYYLIKDNNFKLSNYTNEVLSLIGKGKLKKYLESLNPDVVINTFPVRSMPALYLERKTKVPCFTIITDYGSHSMWIDKGVTKYFVTDDSVKQELIEGGISEKRIKVTGIPVSIQESKLLHKNNFIEEYGFKSSTLPIITIVAGANGVQSYSSTICKDLYELSTEAQFLFICGRNNKLLSSMQEKAEPFSDRIKVQGYANNFHDIMRISDLLVTKAGGITTTEALDIGVPMVIYGYAAGQENENLKFLKRNHLTYSAKDSNELVKVLDILLSNPEILKKMRKKAKEVAKPNGCSDIVSTIIDYME